jgi:hypothetical protein
MSTQVSLIELISHKGNYNTVSNKHLILSFYAKYADTVEKLDFNMPFSEWFADNAIFYNSHGNDILGGSDIWKWIKGPHFGAFDRVPIQHIVTRVIPLLEDVTLAGGELLYTSQGFYRVFDEQIITFIRKGKSEFVAPHRFS